MDDLDQIRERKKQELLKAATIDEQWPSEPADVTDVSFNDFIKRYGMVLVDCWAPWCGPCRMMTPILDVLSREFRGKVAFGKLNTDMNPRTAMRFQIEAIPTLLVFKEGKLVDRIIGAKPKEDLARRLKALM
jgi:thioredoxin 1